MLNENSTNSMRTRWSSFYTPEERPFGIRKGLSCYSALKDTAARYKDRTAIEHGRVLFSYGRLIEEIDKLAAGLAAEGLCEGDHVAVLHNGLPATIISIYACNKLGLNIMLLNSSGTNAFVLEYLENKKIKAVFLTSGQLEQYSSILGKTDVTLAVRTDILDYFRFRDRFHPGVINLLAKDRIRKVGTASSRLPEQIKVTGWFDVISKGRAAGDVPARDGKIAFMNGSASGTLNTVVLSSGGLNEQASSAGFLLRHGIDKEGPVRILSLVEKAFSFGFCIGIHTALLTGNTILLCGEDQTVIPEREISIYKPDVIMGYPTILTDLIPGRRLRKRDMSFIRLVLSGGDIMRGSVHNELKLWLREHGSDAEILRIYGITETSSACIFNPERLGNDRILGIPLPGVRVRILDEKNGGECQTGAEGEIMVSSPGAMVRYYENEDDTMRIRRTEPDGQVWIMTGDLGHVDEDGLVYFDGSRKRKVDIKGLHVYPFVIEKEIMTIYGIENCCVVMVEDKDGERSLIAVVVPSDEIMLDREKLTKLKEDIDIRCELVFPPQMRPASVEFRASLPEKELGKTDFEKVEQEIREEHAGNKEVL